METIFFAPSGVLNASWSACEFERRTEGRSVSASERARRLARRKKRRASARRQGAARKSLVGAGVLAGFPAGVARERSRGDRARPRDADRGDLAPPRPGARAPRAARRAQPQPSTKEKKGNTGAGGGGQNSPHKEGARRTSASSSLPSSLTLNSENPAGVSKRRSIFRGAETRTVCGVVPGRVAERKIGGGRFSACRRNGSPGDFYGFTDPAKTAGSLFCHEKNLASASCEDASAPECRVFSSGGRQLSAASSPVTHSILRASTEDRQRATRQPWTPSPRSWRTPGRPSRRTGRPSRATSGSSSRSSSRAPSAGSSDARSRRGPMPAPLGAARSSR